MQEVARPKQEFDSQGLEEGRQELQVPDARKHGMPNLRIALLAYALVALKSPSTLSRLATYLQMSFFFQLRLS